MWKTFFSAPQNAKKENHFKHKNQVRNRLFYWHLDLRVWRINLVITGWAQKTKFILISKKYEAFRNFFFTHNQLFKQKGVVSNLHVCSNGLGKMWASYIFHFSTTILTSTPTKKCNIFSLNSMTWCPTINFHVSRMSKWLAKHISTKVSFKITILKDRFTLTFVDPNMMTVFPVGIFEIMIKFYDRFAFISDRYTVKFTEHIWNWDPELNLTH